MLPRSKVSLDELLELAQSKRAEQRCALFENIADLFLTEETGYTERERALMRGILDRLLRDVEMEVRRKLAERIADLPGAPPELVNILANDRIEIARPILLRSKALRDPDLIAVVQQRGKEHGLAVSMRPGLTPDVTDALVATGDVDVIERLLQNQDAELSSRAMEYLVAESKHIDRFQEPLVTRADLPAELAARLYWNVTAALRQYLIKTIGAPALDIDEMVEDTTRRLTAESVPDDSIDRTARDLVDRLAERGDLSPVLLIRFLRSGRIGAFIAGLSRHSRIGAAAVRQILFDEGGESLAILCKANAWSRSNFSEAFLLSRRYCVERVVPPAKLDEITRFFDEMELDTADSMLRFWRRDASYLAALERVGGSGDGPRSEPVARFGRDAKSA